MPNIMARVISRLVIMFCQNKCLLLIWLSYFVLVIFIGEFEAWKCGICGAIVVSVESKWEVTSTHWGSDKCVADALRTIVLAE
jgi:hypothetical protein